MSKTRTRKPKQGYLPGQEPPSIKLVDQAADNYYEVMMERCKLSKEEDEKKIVLIEKMKEHGLDRYETADGLIVTITAKSAVKVKPKADVSSNGDGEEEE